MAEYEEAAEVEESPAAVEAAQILAELAAEDEAIEAADGQWTGIEPAEREEVEEAEEAAGDTSSEALRSEVQALRAMNATMQAAHAALARRYDEQRQIDEQLAAQVLAEQERARVPSREEDPLGHFDAKLDAIGEAFRARAEEEEARQRLASEQAQAYAINSAIETACRTAQEEWPEFPQAIQHIASTVVNVLTRSGRSEQEARQIAAGQLNDIAISALRRNQDPADALWEAAWYMGYRYDEPQVEMQQVSAQDPALAQRQSRVAMANARREPRTTTPPAAPLRGTEILNLSQEDLLERFRADPVKAEKEYWKAMEIVATAAE